MAYRYAKAPRNHLRVPVHEGSTLGVPVRQGSAESPSCTDPEMTTVAFDFGPSDRTRLRRRSRTWIRRRKRCPGERRQLLRDVRLRPSALSAGRWTLVSIRRGVRERTGPRSPRSFNVEPGRGSRRKLTITSALRTVVGTIERGDAERWTLVSIRRGVRERTVNSERAGDGRTYRLAAFVQSGERSR